MFKNVYGLSENWQTEKKQQKASFTALLQECFHHFDTLYYKYKRKILERID